MMTGTTNSDIRFDVDLNHLTSLHFKNLEKFDTISHAIFTRKGGLSKEPYRSLNTSYGVGDNPERVEGNRQIIKEKLAAPELVFCRQDHGTEVQVVPSSSCSHDKSEGSKPSIADALVTNVPGKFLVIQVADCQPVLIYDPERNIVANIHSGWRGSIRNIIGRTIRVIQEKFDSSAKDLLAGIGPSLGPCCAEFVNYKNEIPRVYWKYKTVNNHFDFWSISRDQLIEAGLERRFIFSSNICTRCQTDLFYSYRGERETGRFAAVIGLR
jgi:YfiH family protein